MLLKGFFRCTIAGTSQPAWPHIPRGSFIIIFVKQCKIARPDKLGFFMREGNWLKGYRRGFIICGMNGINL